VFADFARRLEAAGAVDGARRHPRGADGAAGLAAPPRGDAAEDGALPDGGGAHQRGLLDGRPRAGVRLRPAGRTGPPCGRLRTRPRMEGQVRDRRDGEVLQKVLHGKGEYKFIQFYSKFN